MPETILISQFPLPYHKIGSWTTMYGNYLTSAHQIDHIICEKPHEKYSHIKYHTFKRGFRLRIHQKLKKNNQIPYIKRLKKIIMPNGKYIIQIVDNFKLASQVVKFISLHYNRSDIYIQFFYHGFPPFLNQQDGALFFKSIDDTILLTKRSLEEHHTYYGVDKSKFSILHNGIDGQKFFPISQNHKVKIKDKLGVSDKKVFLWVSQDKPKKGLDLLLRVWNTISKKYPDVVLLIAGSTRKIDDRSIKVLGKVSNDLLPEYYQASDFYLFTTQCEEGFGMSLTEALKCGCYCIASALGGVPEVLNYGAYGKLIKDPFSEEAWIDTIEESLVEKDTSYLIPEDIYSIDQWISGMNTLITGAKLRLQERE